MLYKYKSNDVNRRTKMAMIAKLLSLDAEKQRATEPRGITSQN